MVSGGNLLEQRNKMDFRFKQTLKNGGREKDDR